MTAVPRFICNGCGQNIDPTQGGGKPKIRCPGCGVMVDLRDMPGYDPKALSAPSSGSGKSRKSDSETFPESESPFETNPFKQETKKKPKAEKPASENPSSEKNKKAETTPVVRPEPDGNMEPPPLPFAPAGPTFQTSLEDDGLPYAMPGGFDFNCPECSMLLKPGTALCTRCGFDMRTGKKKKTTVKPAKRWYGPEFPGKIRATICLVLPPTLMVALYFMDQLNNSVLALQVVGWILLTFFLGTWMELTMERNSKGKTTFTRVVRVAFMPVPAGQYEADYYDGVSTRTEEQNTFTDYIVLISLFGMFILPGVIFYFAVMQRREQAIFLTGEHGASLQEVFRSRNQNRIFEILDEISKISALPKRL